MSELCDFPAQLWTTLELASALCPVEVIVAERIHPSAAVMGQAEGGIPALLVTAAAEELNLAVLHYDADFDHVAGITGQRCEWVVPAGLVA